MWMRPGGFPQLSKLSARQGRSIFSCTKGTPSLRTYSSQPAEPYNNNATEGETNWSLKSLTGGTVIRKVLAPDVRRPNVVFREPELPIKSSPLQSANLERLLTVQIDGVPTHFNCFRLRDACTCSQCVDPVTKQRNFETSDLYVGVRPGNIETKDDKVTITWLGDTLNTPNNREHVSTYTKEELKRLHRGPISRYKRAGPVRIPWNKETYEKNQHWISFDEYMNNDEKFRSFMRSLYRYGLVFVKDVPEDTESVSQIATRMGPLRNSFYGLTWDVRSVPDAKNVAYTNKSLGFHMDLLYMADPPGYQLLHCMNNSLPGGESMFSDTLRVAQHLFRIDRNAYHELWQTPVRFGYFNDGQCYEYTRPTIEGDSFGYSQYVNYSPPFQVSQPRVAQEGGGPDRSLASWAKAMHAFSNRLRRPDGVFELKLKPGECVIFANRRIAHARKAFDLTQSDGQEGSRWLRGAYVDEDALLSKFEILREQNPEEWDATTVDQWMKEELIPLGIRRTMTGLNVGGNAEQTPEDSTSAEMVK
ncbi:hypothetical protein PRK78_004117 [Emydomyces testavorans]|uniref:Gamma-butyrobetaine dioxygenase n=1 Tax=Emydomyces testavorans TaxID=2070801 RepID=A0AAF0ILA0_9EURO|nr:hypothetical protein PRK78_004117 [Emydomyces testavorans]